MPQPNQLIAHCFDRNNILDAMTDPVNFMK